MKVLGQNGVEPLSNNYRLFVLTVELQAYIDTYTFLKMGVIKRMLPAYITLLISRLTHIGIVKLRLQNVSTG